MKRYIRKSRRRGQRSRKIRGGSGGVQYSQFPNPYNTIGFNVNKGNPNYDPSDPANQISSRLLMNGGSNKKRQTRMKRYNNRRKMRTIKGGAYSLLGSSTQLNGVNAFGTTVGVDKITDLVGGTPKTPPIPINYSGSITKMMPLV